MDKDWLVSNEGKIMLILDYFGPKIPRILAAKKGDDSDANHAKS